MTVAGRTEEIIEPLAPGSFASVSITFDLDGHILVKHPRVSAQLQLTPRFTYADHAAGGIFPSLRSENPIHHYQQGPTATGSVSCGGPPRTVDGFGLRDRTWGYRDESVSMDEYIAIVASFPTHTLTAMRIRAADGSDRAEGYRLAGTPERLTTLGMTRDASGLFTTAHINTDDGQAITIMRTDRRAGFWVPMGVERRAPAISAYDEFVALRTADGEHGFGVVEQAIVRKLY